MVEKFLTRLNGVGPAAPDLRAVTRCYGQKLFNEVETARELASTLLLDCVEWAMVMVHHITYKHTNNMAGFKLDLGKAPVPHTLYEQGDRDVLRAPCTAQTFGSRVQTESQEELSDGEHQETDTESQPGERYADVLLVLH